MAPNVELPLRLVIQRQELVRALAFLVLSESNQ
jgi:hypothetical protein